MNTDFLSAQFLQSACSKRKKQVNVTKFKITSGGVVGFCVMSDSPWRIGYMYGGEQRWTSLYPARTDSPVYTYVIPDANSTVIIEGDITALALGDGAQGVDMYHDIESLDLSQNKAMEHVACNNCTLLNSIDPTGCTKLKYFNCGGCTSLIVLDFTKNIALEELYCGGCTGLAELELGTNVALQTINCANCSGLQALDLTANTDLLNINCYGCTGLTTLNLATNIALQSLYCGGSPNLVSISYPATESDPSTAIAAAITAATSTTGTVYTDSNGTYYSTIADAATTKGWNIQPINQ
jgi:hypothetical protein